MTLDTLKDSLPDYARDLKLNLGSLEAETSITQAQKAGCFIASAIACKEPTVLAAMMETFGPQLSPSQLNGAKIAAALMAMNNIYYRFVHIASNQDYGKLRANLRMNALKEPGAPKEEFDLWALSVSVINGCGMCIDAHEKVLRDSGQTTEQIQAGAKIGAVVHAVAVVLASEKILKTPAGGTASAA